MDDLDYNLIRAKRKTVSLCVREDLSVEVRAPLRMPRREIDRFVQRHADWIARQQTRLAERSSRREAFAFKDGDRLFFCGEETEIASGLVPGFVGQPPRLLLVPGDEREAQLVALFRAASRARAQRGIETFAPQLGAFPESWKITSAKTRWGSCSGKNRLCFSWRCACLPDLLFDYVVVHELCHILEHNHSARFWALVEQLLPDWKARRHALRDERWRLPF